MAARDNLQWVELQVLHRAHSCGRTRATTPAPPRPQTLFAKDKAPGNVDVNC
jgi:hypothetical protein